MNPHDRLRQPERLDQRPDAAAPPARQSPDPVAMQKRLAQLHSAMGVAEPQADDTPRRPQRPPVDVLASLSSAAQQRPPRSRNSLSWLLLLPVLGLGLWWMSRGPVTSDAADAAAVVAHSAPVLVQAPAVAPAPVPPSPAVAAPVVAPAPVAAAPVAAAPVSAPPAPQDTLKTEVERWRQAWAARDVEAYLAFYSPGFQPANGQSRDEWAAGRRRIIGSRKSIVLSLSDLQLQADAPDRWRTQFLQDYASDGLVEKQLPKTLEWALEEGQWRIVAERAGSAPARKP